MPIVLSAQEKLSDTLTVIRKDQTIEKNGLLYAPYTGLVREYYENGNKKLEAYWVEGKPHGTSIVWYENGQKMGEVMMVNGEPEGLFAEQTAY